MHAILTKISPTTPQEYKPYLLLESNTVSINSWKIKKNSAEFRMYGFSNYSWINTLRYKRLSFG